MEFVIVLFAIWLVSIPFDIISGTIKGSIWGFHLGGLGDILAGIINLFFELINLAVSFLLIYSFIKTRVMTIKPVMPQYTDQDYNKENVSADSETSEQYSSFNPENANFDVNTGKPLKKQKTLGEVGKNSGDFIVKMVVVILKVFLLDFHHHV